MDDDAIRGARPLLELMSSHRSVRDFEPTPVPRAHLEAAIGAARQAASSKNVQPYGAILVEDAAERATLAELCGDQAQVREAGAFLVICGDLRRSALLARRDGAGFVANLEAFMVAAIDASLFAQNLVLALEGTGYGTCYIGGLRTRIDEVDALLELPELVLPLYGLCVGVPRSVPDSKPRFHTDAILHAGRYPSDAEVLADVERYDAAMEPHFAARGKPGWSWSGAIARQFARPVRPHLAGYYRRKGIDFGEVPRSE
ncbi:MAG: nitroreductase family protein [Planctomycetota bacterium]